MSQETEPGEEKVTYQYTYNGDGAMMMESTGTVTTIYIGGIYEYVVSGAEVITRSYYYAGSQRVAMREGGELFYLLGDHLGSTSLTLDASGNKVAEQRFSPWGMSRYAWGNEKTDYGFTGQRSNGYINLIKMGVRWYDPALGRFTQPDSIVPGAGNPMAYDRYMYTFSNPLRYSDPSGHIPECGPDGMWCDDVITADEYFITFTTAGGEEWEAANQAAVLEAVYAVAKKLGSYMEKTAGLAWMTVFGFMTFQMGGCDECNGTGGFAANFDLIKFASFPADWREDRALRARNLVTHELGHAFSQGHGRKPETALGEAQKNPLFPNRPNFPENTPDGWTGGRYGYASEQNVLTWQMSSAQAGTLSEEFADMFLGWTFGVWDASDAGVMRSNFMITTMFDVLNTYYP
ncbi:MAG: RHS repeat-associated core domain-containing protein [Sedimentisphaerales bacterium]|nr:RHS repeat-associated core domain-containing protein [Sedimentisphaerales bacterium]